MNQEKAREFFSAYYEGTLEPGLRQTLEQRLRADSQLQDEYQSFEAVMSELDTLKFEEIEVPSYLSDRIATRLEEVQEKTRSKVPAWSIWLRGLAFSGLAAAAIFGALLQFNHGAGPSTSSVLPGAGDVLTIDSTGSDVVMNYQASQRETLTISSAGRQLKTLNLSDGQQVQSSLGNPHPDAAVFEVAVNNKPIWVAVPGTEHLRTATGSGTVKEFAADLAGFYRVPVLLEVANPDRTATWTFDDEKALAAANNALTSDSYSMDELENGVIEIKDR